MYIGLLLKLLSVYPTLGQVFFFFIYIIFISSILAAVAGGAEYAFAPGTSIRWTLCKM